MSLIINFIKLFALISTSGSPVCDDHFGALEDVWLCLLPLATCTNSLFREKLGKEVVRLAVFAIQPLLDV